MPASQVQTFFTEQARMTQQSRKGYRILGSMRHVHVQGSPITRLETLIGSQSECLRIHLIARLPSLDDTMKHESYRIPAISRAHL